MNRRIAATVLLFFAFCLGARSADDPLIGTWKLNLAKSKLVPLPKSRIVTIVQDGSDGIKLKTEEITAEGGKRTVEYSAKFDGKEYPRIETGAGAIEGQTVTLKRMDPNRAERTIYLAGEKAEIGNMGSFQGWQGQDGAGGWYEFERSVGRHLPRI